MRASRRLVDVRLTGPGTTVVGVGLILAAGAAIELSYVARHPGLLPVHVVIADFYDIPLTLPFAIVGTAVLRRSPRHPIGRLFVVIGAIVAMSFFHDAYVLADRAGLVWVHWIWRIVRGPALVLLAWAVLLFPTGRPPSRRWRWVHIAMAAFVAVAAVVESFTPWVSSETSTINPLGIAGLGPLTALEGGMLPEQYAVAFPVTVPFVVIALASLVARWRTAGGEERDQVRWLTMGALVFVTVTTLGTLSLALGGADEDTAASLLIGDAIWGLAAAAIPVTMGLAIVRYRLYDVERLMSRTLTYGASLGVIGLTYVGVVVGLGGLAEHTVAPTVVGLLVSAVAAIAFQPLRRRLGKRADRIVYGSRAEPYELMTRFGDDLSRAIEPGEALGRIAETVAIAAAADAARVSVLLPERALAMATWPADLASRRFDETLTVRDGAEAVGFIEVDIAEARPGTIDLLAQVASISSASFRNIRLQAELEHTFDSIRSHNEALVESNTRLLAAAQEERDRLSRLMSIAVDPQLREIRAGLPAMYSMAASGSLDIVDEARRHVARAVRVVDEIRALSRGVLPRVLSDHGLVPALRALVRRIDAPVSLVASFPDDSIRYDPRAEAALYLTCHTLLGAFVAGDDVGPITLRIWDDDRVVWIAVEGVVNPGIDDALSASHDRIATLGGTVDRSEHDGRQMVTCGIPHEEGVAAVESRSS